MLYLDGEIIKKVKCEIYPPSIIYMNNSLGCTLVQTENLNAKITAMYFIKIKKPNILHEFLVKIYRVIDVENFISFISIGESIYNNNPTMHKIFSIKNLQEEDFTKDIFLCVNPFLMPEAFKLNKSNYEIIPSEENSIREIYHSTKIYSNMSIRNCIESMGGINCLLPFLNYIVDANKEPRNLVLKKLFEIIKDFASNNIQLMEFFLGNNNSGLAILYYLLENLAKKIPFDSEILDFFESLLPIIKKYYLSFFHEYLSLICYNTNLWINSDDPTQILLINHIKSQFEIKDQALISHYVDILLSFIEAYSREEFPNLNKIKIIKDIIFDILSNNITDGFVSILFSSLFICLF